MHMPALGDHNSCLAALESLVPLVTDCGNCMFYAHIGFLPQSLKNTGRLTGFDILANVCKQMSEYVKHDI